MVALPVDLWAGVIAPLVTSGATSATVRATAGATIATNERTTVASGATATASGTGTAHGNGAIGTSIEINKGRTAPAHAIATTQRAALQSGLLPTLAVMWMRPCCMPKASTMHGAATSRAPGRRTASPSGATGVSARISTMMAQCGLERRE